MQTKPRGWTQAEWDADSVEFMVRTEKISVEEARAKHARWIQGVIDAQVQKGKPGVYAILNSFLRGNRVIKKPCVCGEHRVHMHHPDYTEPFKVAFLCARCHRHHHLGRLQQEFQVYDVRDLAVESLVAST